MMKDRLISEHRFVEDLYGCLDGFDFDLEDVLNVLKGVESVDATPVVHAHWIRGERLDRFWCSRCNRITYTDISPFIFDYCFSCGAKMDDIGAQNGM